MKIVIIGGSSGIGDSCLKQLKSHHTVINLSRRRNKLADYNYYCDVTNYDSVNSAFNTMIHDLGFVDVLIYSAGFVEPQNLLDIKPKTWDKTISTNLSGAFYATQLFTRYCKENSKIIYIASTAGTRPSPNWSAYSASKSGLINFGITMSEELKKYKIKTYVLSCGRCATPLRAKLAPEEDPNSIMQPEEVAKLIDDIIEDEWLLDGQNIIVKRNA